MRKRLAITLSYIASAGIFMGIAKASAPEWFNEVRWQLIANMLLLPLSFYIGYTIVDRIIRKMQK